MKQEPSSHRFAVNTEPTDEEVEEFRKGFDAYNMEQTDGEYNSPEEWLSLVLKDHDGNIVGGVMTSTLYWVQYLEVLWVDEKYRGLGYGRDLVLASERLAKKNGCLASQTYTFSWQGDGFYQAIGYKLIATYDGYVNGITELILSKRLDTVDDRQTQKIDPARFTVVQDSSKESQTVVHRGLGKDFQDNVADLFKEHPQIMIQFIIKDRDARVIGGLSGYSILGTMTIDDLWVDERYRGLGYGRDLLAYAEETARKRGCIAFQTHCFSFQNIGFLRTHGFEEFGESDVFPKAAKEYYLIKRL